MRLRQKKNKRGCEETKKAFLEQDHEEIYKKWLKETNVFVRDVSPSVS